MKIVVINNLYAPWARGGAERVVEKIAAGLEKAGHEVFVIATAPKGSRTEKIYYLESIFYNLEKYPLAVRFFWHFFELFNFLKTAEIKKILKEKRPDLVITNNLMGLGFLLPGLLKKMKIKHVHILHDIQLLHPSGLMLWGKEKIIDSFQAKIYQAISLALFGSPAAVVSPSQWLLDLHAGKGFFKNSKKNILPNYFSDKNGHSRPRSPARINSGGNSGFDAATLDSRLRGNDVKNRGVDFVFLYVGQIEDHKGVKFLVETFLKFLEKNNKAELMVVGPGSQLEEIKSLAAAHPEIKVLGRKNSAEVAELMRKADCLVVSSLCYENSPTVIYEAFASGLPVIASRLGGMPELIEAGGGLTFKPENKEDLMAKMELIFTRSEESDRIRAKEAANQPDDYIAKLLEL